MSVIDRWELRAIDNSVTLKRRYLVRTYQGFAHETERNWVVRPEDNTRDNPYAFHDADAAAFQLWGAGVSVETQRAMFARALPGKVVTLELDGAIDVS